MYAHIEATPGEAPSGEIPPPYVGLAEDVDTQLQINENQ